MRRRYLLVVIGGTAVGWPVAARAEAAMPVIGYISAAAPEDYSDLVQAFSEGLGKAG